MSNKLSIKSLFNKFPPTTREDWLKAASVETKTNTIDQLTWKGPTELSFLPYYDKRDHDQLDIKNIFDLVPAPGNFHGARSWLNLPSVFIHDERLTNHRARHHLENGADGVFFECPEHVDFKILLNGIQLEHCQIHFAFTHSLLAKKLFDYIDEHYPDPQKVNGGIFWKKKSADSEVNFTDLTTAKNFFSLGVWIESKHDPSDEIVEALLTGINLADKLTDKGYDLEKIFSSISFSLETGSEFFFTIAKLKALRILWYQVVRSYGFDYPFEDIYIHMRCEAFHDEKYGPQANMLKSPLAGLSAAIGGCQALSVYPQEQTNPMLERVARNISSILKEESHIDIVADPTAGSYFMDTLVNNLALHAWTKLQEKMSQP